MRYTTLIGTVRARHVAVATVLLLPVAALLAWDFMTSGPLDEPTQTIVAFGYQVLVPPSTIHLPGTINTVEIRSDGAVQLHPTCRMDRDVLAATMQQSITTVQERTARLENGFDVTAALRKVVGSTAVGEKVRSVRLSLRDMRILFMSDETLRRIRKQYIKDECQEAIMHNLSAGARVCQTEEVLQADAVYRIDYWDKLATDQRIHTAQAFAAKLGLSESTSEVEEIRGNDLFYGIKLKRYCIVPDGAEPQVTPLR